MALRVSELVFRIHFVCLSWQIHQRKFSAQIRQTNYIEDKVSKHPWNAISQNTCCVSHQ